MLETIPALMNVRLTTKRDLNRIAINPVMRPNAAVGWTLARAGRATSALQGRWHNRPCPMLQCFWNRPRALPLRAMLLNAAATRAGPSPTPIAPLAHSQIRGNSVPVVRVPFRSAVTPPATIGRRRMGTPVQRKSAWKVGSNTVAVKAVAQWKVAARKPIHATKPAPPASQRVHGISGARQSQRAAILLGAILAPHVYSKSKKRPSPRMMLRALPNSSCAGHACPQLARPAWSAMPRRSPFLSRFPAPLQAVPLVVGPFLFSLLPLLCLPTSSIFLGSSRHYVLAFHPVATVAEWS